ncbi:M23 family metallopeptidase [Vampirovibrio sp.]|uniref:M23 family metallopeptidase n=1 Tax=Vampirovibrio sp. TaxID=2717857 RepID=UPI0035935C0A
MHLHLLVKNSLRACLWVSLMVLAFCSSLSLAADYGFAPVSGQMTSPFGWRVDPITGSQRFHGGIDLAAASGTPVYAPQAGLVMFSGSYGGYGNVVVLNHGNALFTLYGHNAQLVVKAGEMVHAGQVISKVGSTGRSTGPHLHFEVHHNGQYVNPVTYLAYLQPNQSHRMAQAKSNVPVHPLAQSDALVNASGVGVQSSTANQVNRKRYANRAYGSQVVELVSGNDVRTVKF